MTGRRVTILQISQTQICNQEPAQEHTTHQPNVTLELSTVDPRFPSGLYLGLVPSGAPP
jgi:hypothetical protein